MASLARTIGRHFDAGERRRLGIFYAIIVLLHVLGWGTLLLYVAPRYPVMVGLGGLAYTFGLRHAFDADHISAIDNTTRKLLQDRQKPMGVGFFFSLGHATVVFLISLGLGLTVHFIVTGIQGGSLKNTGSLVGTAVSGVFLLLIGVLNLIILLDIFGVYRRMKQGDYSEAELDDKLTAGGFMTRIFGRLFKVIRFSWQMYFIGFLFGLGFDTASEVALLAVSAGAIANGLPLLAVLSLPMIFAAGMALMDTTDGAFMSKAYSWAFSNPIRKVFYNLTVTGLSVFVALFVGGIEVLQILSGQFNWAGGFWAVIDNLDFNKMGFIIVAAFAVTWIAAFTIWKARRIEERWGTMVKQA
jgi:nickel/cobalt transporter (NiCoT) family protein